MFDVEKFISAVERRPAIYNSKLKEYSNRDIKRMYWDEIGEEMYEKWGRYSAFEKNELGKLMQTKWKSIRDHFKKELRANSAKKRKYIYYDNLLFLIPLLDENHHNTPNPTLLTESDYLEVSEEQLAETLASNSAESSTNETNLTPSTSTASCALPEPPRRKRMEGNKKTNEESENTAAIKELTKMLAESIALQKEEMSDISGNRAFLLSLLPFMNQISDEEILTVRIILMNVVREGLKKPKYPQHHPCTPNLQEPLAGGLATSAATYDDINEKSIFTLLETYNYKQLIGKHINT